VNLFTLPSRSNEKERSKLKGRFGGNVNIVAEISAQKKEQSCELLFFLCHIVPNHRTFIDDYLKILDFIDWLKVAYPEKAKFLTKKS
jgi:hypothetical protein